MALFGPFQAQGFQQAEQAQQELGLRSRALDIQQSESDLRKQALQQDTYKEVVTRTEDRLKKYGQMLKLEPALLKSPAFQQIINKDIGVYRQALQGANMDPSLADTAAQSLNIEAGLPGETQAKLNDVQRALGPISRAQQEKVAGAYIPPEDQPKAQTAAGKTVMDEELIKQQFGENSPQHQAFQKYMQDQQSGAKLTDESSLRGQYFQQSKDFVTVRDAFNKIAASSQQPSAAGDLAMIFNFMKVLDPISVVREGEFATAQNAASVPERVRSMYNRVISGERLTEPQRADFLNQAEIIFQSAVKTQAQLANNIRGIAQRTDMNPENVAPDLIGTEFRTAVTPPAQLPEGVPEGSTLIGQTKDGNPIYETPDGKRLVVEPEKKNARP